MRARFAGCIDGPHETIEMTEAIGAFAVAKRMLGDLTLTAGQLTQLRAIDRKYQQALFALLDGADRPPTSAEVAQLDEIAAREVLDMLTPDQRTQARRR